MMKKTISPLNDFTEKQPPKTERPKLLVSIVERGKGKAIMKLYNSEGVNFHYQTTGHGTATSEIMDILGLDSKDKDIVLSFSAESMINQLVYRMGDELRGIVDTKGILFDIPLTGMSNMIAAALNIVVSPEKRSTASTASAGLLEKTLLNENDTSDGKEETNMSESSSEKKYSLILVTVNQGYTENVLDTARSLGARGGTILRARWSGSKAFEKHHSIASQTEKEIIALVVANELRNPIMDTINHEYGVKSDAQAVVCSMKVDHFCPI